MTALSTEYCLFILIPLRHSKNHSNWESNSVTGYMQKSDKPRGNTGEELIKTKQAGIKQEVIRCSRSSSLLVFFQLYQSETLSSLPREKVKTQNENLTLDEEEDEEEEEGNERDSSDDEGEIPEE